MPDTLADWLTYLESLNPKTIALGLARVAQVKQRLDLECDFPIITVGGTNGKGSVCAMLESILHAAGYRVGCYTSPHLLYYNERVRIAKRQASDAELCASFEKIEQARGDVPLTYFEFGTLAAMQLFIEQKVDVAVLEVGLGGRLDAVNLFDNDCAVIASVDIDHIDYLGDTREKIAFEKAGIMRRDKVAICGDANVPQAIRVHAKEIGADLWCIGDEFGFKRHQGQWDYYSKIGPRHGLPHPALRGAFQLYNASAVLAALDALKDKLPVSMEAVRRGLAEVRLPGRFQFVPGKPTLILDVAHNPHAARSLAQNLAELQPCPHTYAVFAMLKDKDMEGVAAALGPHIDTWLLAGIVAPRGATAAEVAEALRRSGARGEMLVFDKISDAVSYAYNVAGENDRIVAFGSFHTVAEAMTSRGLSITGNKLKAGEIQSMAKEQAEDELNLRRKARRRLIGAFALTLAVVVILPMVLESEPKPSGKDIDLRIPAPDKVGEFVPRVPVSEAPAAPPTAASQVVTTTIPLATPQVAAPTPAQDEKKALVVPAQDVLPSKTTERKPSEANKSTETGSEANSANAEGFVAQVGAYSNSSTAKRELKKLKKWGFKAYIEKSGDKIRVRVGPYTDREKAEKVVRLLEKHGLHPVVMTIP